MNKKDILKVINEAIKSYHVKHDPQNHFSRYSCHRIADACKKIHGKRSYELREFYEFDYLGGKILGDNIPRNDAHRLMSLEFFKYWLFDTDEYKVIRWN